MSNDTDMFSQVKGCTMGDITGTVPGEVEVPRHLTATPSVREDVLAAQHSIASTATRMPTAQLARELNDHLGGTLVAYMANARDRKISYKWAAGESSPRSEAHRRLQIAYRAWEQIAASDGSDVARSWFIGANPWLGERSPVEIIRDGDGAAVLAAVAAFVTDQGGA